MPLRSLHLSAALSAIVLASCASAAPASPTASAPAAVATSVPTASIAAGTPATAAGFTVDTILDAFDGAGLTCEGSEASIGVVQNGKPSKAYCWKHPGGNTYLEMSIEGASPAKIPAVTLSYSTLTQGSSRAGIKAFFDLLTSLGYAGSAPGAAASWLDKAWTDVDSGGAAETDIGPGHFTLQHKDDPAGSLYTFELTAPEGSFFE